MTKEQREAIEICKEKIIEPFYDFPNPTSIEIKDTDVRVIEIVLSLIKEQEKQIDLMADKLVEAHEWFYSEFDNFTKEDFIEYFETKAKKGE